MSKITLKFTEPSQLHTYTRQIGWLFPFNLVDSSLIGEPEEDSSTRVHFLSVYISMEQAATWGYHNFVAANLAQSHKIDLMKVLFEYGKRHICKKLKETGELDTEEKLSLFTYTTDLPKICPFEPSRIKNPDGLIVEVEINSINRSSADAGVEFNNEASPLVANDKPIGANLPELRRLLTKHCSEEDLKTFCFDLSEDYQSIVSANSPKITAVIDIVRYLHGRGRILELIELAKMEFPELDWFKVLGQSHATVESHTSPSNQQHNISSGDDKHTVISINQTGGQTAHSIINAGKVQRSFSEQNASILITRLVQMPKERIHLRSYVNDVETTMLATRLKSALNASGWEATDEIVLNPEPQIGVVLCVNQTNVQSNKSLMTLVKWLDKVGLYPGNEILLDPNLEQPLLIVGIAP